MKKLNHSQIIWILVLLILIAMLIYPQLIKKDTWVAISSFQECMDAGHPIMESYPRQCHDGNQTFVEEIEEDTHTTACPDDGKICPDGSFVGREWPSCEFAACPDEDTVVFCTMDAKQCPDGSFVGRVGPNCEFAPCPGEE